MGVMVYVLQYGAIPPPPLCTAIFRGGCVFKRLHWEGVNRNRYTGSEALLTEKTTNALTRFNGLMIATQRGPKGDPTEKP